MNAPAGIHTAVRIWVRGETLQPEQTVRCAAAQKDPVRRLADQEAIGTRRPSESMRGSPSSLANGPFWGSGRRSSSANGVPFSRSKSRGRIFMRAINDSSVGRSGGVFRYSIIVGSMPAFRISASVLREVPQPGLWGEGEVFSEL